MASQKSNVFVAGVMIILFGILAIAGGINVFVNASMGRQAEPAQGVFFLIIGVGLVGWGGWIIWRAMGSKKFWRRPRKPKSIPVPVPQKKQSENVPPEKDPEDPSDEDCLWSVGETKCPRCGTMNDKVAYLCKSCECILKEEGPRQG